MKNTKTYAQKIRQNTREKIAAKIKCCIDNHENFRNSYFWHAPASAGERRRYEKDNSWSESFTYDGVEYEYIASVSCTCSNVYYTGSFYMNGKKVTVREFKKILREIEDAMADYEKRHKKSA